LGRLFSKQYSYNKNNYNKHYKTNKKPKTKTKNTLVKLSFLFLFWWDCELGLCASKLLLYCLTHTSIPFCSGYFGDGVFYSFGLASN
jgi:hypothetical protein